MLLMLQELPFPSAGDLSAMNVAAVSPSFGSSDTSLHSDFTGASPQGLTVLRPCELPVCQSDDAASSVPHDCRPQSTWQHQSLRVKNRSAPGIALTAHTC